MTVGDFKEWLVVNKISDEAPFAIFTNDGGFHREIFLDTWPGDDDGLEYVVVEDQ